MSGAADQRAYGNAGAGRSGWGGSPWGSGPSPQQGPWMNNGFPWWSIPRPLLIAGTIIGFMFWWPVGLVMLCIAIWNKKAMRGAYGYGPGWSNGAGNGSSSPPWANWKSWGCSAMRGAPPSSGNHAFDEYRNQTLQRLEEEQREFAAFLERLRFARDKSEFDQFMADRRQPPATTQNPEPPRSDN